MIQLEQKNAVSQGSEKSEHYSSDENNIENMLYEKYIKIHGRPVVNKFANRKTVHMNLAKSFNCTRNERRDIARPKKRW